ncbi:MAG: YIP1 family protein [Methanomicrobiales archaeon]|nr:YIP1 family protein [Methanomicrobiales archaeon]
MFNELLTNPRNFFTTISQNEPSLKKPALIVLAMAVIGSISGYMMGELSGKMLSGLMEGIETITAISAAGSTFIGSCIMWLIAAIILFALQKVLQGTGTFKRVMEISGYGMIPLVIATIISVIIGAYYIPQAEITPIRTTDPQEISMAAMSLLEDPALHQYTIISTIISIIFLIWVANLWSIGVESCCGLSAKKALIVGGLPVVIYIAYTLSSLLLFTGGAA